MKTSSIYTLGLSLLLGLTSCDKFLDLTPKGQIVVEKTEDFYSLVSYPNRGYPINNFQYLVDDQWIKESNIIGVSKRIDVINFYFDDSESRVNYMTSSTLYNRTYTYINRWNMIITLIDESKGADSLKVLGKAEAKVYRAYDHFLLVNTFAKSYVKETANTDGGICIMDKYDLEAKPTKATVEEVYNFILKDLDEAIPDLQTTPIDVYHPSLAFALAFKAKVLLFKKEYALAEEAARQSLALNDFIFDMVTYTTQGGPTRVPMPAGANKEVMSYMYMTGRNELNFGYSYIISPELVQLFGKNDARYNLFFNSTNASFLDIGSGTAYWVTRFTDYFYPTVGMRSPETHLILAECLARQNSIGPAMDVINNLRRKRITLASEATLPTPATIKETMDIIIAERRKELLFGFNRFFDLKRYNTEPEYAKTIVRKFPLVRTTVPQQTYTLPPDSKLYIIPFAQDVLKLNTTLTVNSGETLPW
ncbi:RagB/SusD family nutrient uptake outer membrane protein [Chitinophaga horti]|uniref:RagB/SusD family nutrient uptake outer membrane protein n=1 Tax=Chitinophaga horti TaxID=2920382 RepID=A0ABY6J3R3_9BACT|nr:RagB/SusD family nutrient uptake outer membrane protein [Chitinophaga horti]UYQ94308.1 RagB/SusD family nutrient uptake outer membrane protein [Chitinophaga horti]